jgi:hypothetical protein
VLEAERYWREQQALSAHPELGDGLVARTCAEVQRRYWSSPVERGAPGRWGR